LAPPFGIELRFTEEQVTVERYAIEAGELAEERTPNLREQVLLCLLNDAAFPKEIAESVDAEYRSVKNEVSRLRREGLVEDTGVREGQAQQVRLTDSGRRVAAGVTTSRPSVSSDDAVTRLGDAAYDAPDGEWRLSI
jgi:DNA-binding MarR family transcriptional regulator